MTAVDGVRPILFTIDTSAQAVHQRFSGWPDLFLTDTVLADLARGPEHLPDETRRLLSDKSLLQGLSFRLPILERLPVARWEQAIEKAIEPRLGTLRELVGLLQTTWQSKHGHSTWTEVAHSLLIGFVLWGCGSQLLLSALDCKVMAAIVLNPDTTNTLWHGFVRGNQQYGVSWLLGKRFGDSQRVHELLKGLEVGQALDTLAEDGSLLVLHPQALKVLQRLGGLTAEKADQSGMHYTAWPIVNETRLDAVRPEITLLLAALNLLIEETVSLLSREAALSFPELQQGDLALIFYALLAEILAGDWERSGRIPAVTNPMLNSLR